MMQTLALGDLRKQSMTPGLWCLAGTLPRRQELLGTQTKNGKLMGAVDCNCLSTTVICRTLVHILLCSCNC